MGLYLNPGNEVFAEIIASDTYVDKTGLISYMNGQIGKAKHLIASSRPRRFGKTMATVMLSAYYSLGCDSEGLFSNLEISRDPSFEKHLNKYDVISLDIQAMRGIGIKRAEEKRTNSYVEYIQMEVVRELKKAYPQYVAEDETLIAPALTNINEMTGRRFVIIIDEWDTVFREDKEDIKLQKEYIDFLRSLFKGSLSDRFIRLAYITGILPIKKYGTQSALNNFRELTMILPGGIANYIGFTEKEVKALCEKHKMPFGEMQKWYDGYIFRRENLSCYDTEDSNLKSKYVETHIYSPNSVMEAIDNEKYDNYWSKTETYEFLKTYIEMDFDGLRSKILGMLGGERCHIEVDSFQNDMVSMECADDILTMLVHLGYLAYDGIEHEAFIPNEEVRNIFVLSVRDKGWGNVYQAIRDSEKLLKATLAMDEDTVAEMIENVHRENTSSIVYNSEISLASVVRIAYYSAAKDYNLVRELPAGKGFADMAFIPKRKSDKPALLIELKWDGSAEGAIEQIRNRKYVEGLKEYRDNILLVGINYDKKTKEHQCRIEKA